MKTYRRNGSIYIFTHYHLEIELLYLFSETSEYFNRNKAENLVKVRARLKAITEYVEKIPTYGSETERKKKFTAPTDYKKHLLSELTTISQRINNPPSGTHRVLQCANVLELIKRLGIYNKERLIYYYDSKAENFELTHYREKYAKCKKLFKTGYS